MVYAGELIALTTVLCWTVSVQFFETAAKKIGAVPVNVIRLTSALVFFCVMLFFKNGQVIPLGLSMHAWVYLSLSGVIGFFLGDIFLFKALVELGPRIALVIFSLSAPTSAFIGWIFLDETYVVIQWAGMLVTFFGVCIVIWDRKPGRQNNSNTGKIHRKATVKGVIYGTGAMLGQAVGYILSKAGMQTSSGFINPFTATQIRVLAALACFIVYFTLARQWGKIHESLHDKKSVGYTVIGAFIGPFIGVSLSLKVLHYLTTGVASTFLSLTPVCIIPFSIFLYKEHVSIRGFTGAIIAVSGIWLLMAG